jgi:hypothetical protein
MISSTGPDIEDAAADGEVAGINRPVARPPGIGAKTTSLAAGFG